MKFIHELKKIKKSFSHREPLIKIMVSQDNILHNFQEFKNQTPKNVKVCPVLKSNAYGHGLKEIASMFKNQDNPFLVIESLFEKDSDSDEEFHNPYESDPVQSDRFLKTRELKD